MNKRFLYFLISLFLIFSLFMIQCQHEIHEFGKENSSKSAIGEIEEKIYSNATMEKEFADDGVAIVLTKAASKNFRIYTPEDFPEIECLRIIDATVHTMDVIRQQLEAQRTGDWSKLKERIDNGMLVNEDNFRRIFYIELSVKDKLNVLHVINILEQRDDIFYVGPNYKMKLSALPVPAPSHIVDQMQVLNSISLPQAWDIVVGHTELMVGIIDSGIHATHLSFKEQIYTNFISGRDFTTGNQSGMVAPYGMEDENGHGTHVAGIIGANGTGVIGTCWNIKLIPLRVFTDFLFAYNTRLIFALDFATGVGIPILNFSGGNSDNCVFTYAAINNYPGLFVCSAGNNYEDNDDDIHSFYPSSWTVDRGSLPALNNLLSVGAYTITSTEERIAISPDIGWDYGSNWGATTVDIFAPGTSIWSTSISPNYIQASGTSMAAPYVTGVAALIKSLKSNITAAELKTIIRNSAEHVPQLIGKCNTNGKLNAYNAIMQIPIIGTIDINFDNRGIIGKYHLFADGRGRIVDYKIDSNIISFNPNNNLNYISWGPVPSTIANYINQSGRNNLPVDIYLKVPVGSVFVSRRYTLFSLYADIYPNRVTMGVSPRTSTLENLNLLDRRKILIYGYTY